MALAELAPPPANPKYIRFRRAIEYFAGRQEEFYCRAATTLQVLQSYQAVLEFAVNFGIVCNLNFSWQNPPYERLIWRGERGNPVTLLCALQVSEQKPQKSPGSKADLVSTNYQWPMVIRSLDSIVVFKHRLKKHMRGL